MPFLPRPSAKKYALNFPIRTLSLVDGRGKGGGAEPEEEHAVTGNRDSPKHGEGVAKTELKKTRANK